MINDTLVENFNLKAMDTFNILEKTKYISKENYSILKENHIEKKDCLTFKTIQDIGFRLTSNCDQASLVLKKDPSFFKYNPRDLDYLRAEEDSGNDSDFDNIYDR